MAKKARRLVRPDELRVARTWWMKVYVTLVHRVQQPKAPPKLVGLTDLDLLVAADAGASLSYIRCVRNGWDNLSERKLKALSEKLGIFSANHSVAVMGKCWQQHLEGIMSLIQGERANAKVHKAVRR